MWLACEARVSTPQAACAQSARTPAGGSATGRGWGDVSLLRQDAPGAGGLGSLEPTFCTKSRAKAGKCVPAHSPLPVRTSLGAIRPELWEKARSRSRQLAQPSPLGDEDAVWESPTPYLETTPLSPLHDWARCGGIPTSRSHRPSHRPAGHIIWKGPTVPTRSGHSWPGCPALRARRLQARPTWPCMAGR